MRPISPIVPGCEQAEIVFAKDQPQYLPLPALRVEDGTRIITRWRLSWRERLTVLLRGDLYLWVSTFGKPLQPVMLDTRVPEVSLE